MCSDNMYLAYLSEVIFMKNKKLIYILGILGVISFISYLSAVLFSPLAYPGYNPLTQAVSDLSAVNAPSLRLWNILSCFYGPFSLLTVTLCSIVISETKANKLIKIGVYVFALMNYISSIGYSLFPLTEAGYAGTFQDIMHVYVVTALVVITSIIGLVLIGIGGLKNNTSRFLGIFAFISLGFMMLGAIGTGALPKSIFGIFERFSTLSASFYVAILGIWLFKDAKLNEVK